MSDAEILELLAKSWGIDDGKFEVWGELPPISDTSYGFVRNPYLVTTGEQLYYPLKGQEKEPSSFFMASSTAGFTISIPMTFFAFFARQREMVPVPQ